MDKPIIVYKNMVWEILSDESKLLILSLLLDNGFEGNCKLISVVDGESTIMEVTDESDHKLVLPINILDILNN